MVKQKNRLSSSLHSKRKQSKGTASSESCATVHKMASKETPAMKTNPKFIFFTDFDGTITLQDSMWVDLQWFMFKQAC